MRFPLLLAGLLACLVFPASAAECEFPFFETLNELAHAGAPSAIVPDEELPALVAEVEEVSGKDLGEVTRGFIVEVGGKILLGLEVDGCLLPPIVLGLETPAGHKSGQTPDGKIGA